MIVEVCFNPRVKTPPKDLAPPQVETMAKKSRKKRKGVTARVRALKALSMRAFQKRHPEYQRDEGFVNLRLLHHLEGRKGPYKKKKAHKRK